MNILDHLKQEKIFNFNLFGVDASITNGVITMFLAALIVFLFFCLVSRRAKLIPKPAQSLAEYSLDFIRLEMLSPLGREGERWLPFVLSLFSFILVCNLLGVIPGLLPPTSNINTTATLAIIIFLMTQAVGIYSHGPIRYFKSFVPSGIPLFIALFLLPIEIIGQCARPFSLAVRLFANMFAGHAIILALISLIFLFRNYLIIPLPIIGDVAISAFEIFVSFIQAFIFTYLSTTYIVGALQTEH